MRYAAGSELFMSDRFLSGSDRRSDAASKRLNFCWKSNSKRTLLVGHERR